MQVSRPRNSDIVTGIGLAARPAAVGAPRPDDRPDPRPRTGSDVVGTVPLGGQPGHGAAAFLRNQPARITDGHILDGFNGVYELICPNCGDDPDLDYLEVASRLQLLRGPRSLTGGWPRITSTAEFPGPRRAQSYQVLARQGRARGGVSR